MRLFLLILGCLLCLDCHQSGAGQPGGSDPSPEPNTLAPSADLQLEDVENKQEVWVYFRHPDLDAIVPLKRQIYKLANLSDQVKQVIEQLSIAPNKVDGIAIWPATTYVRETFLLANGTVVIDFHESFVGGINAGVKTESFLVFSLVATVLDNFPKYDKVQLLVQGEVRETLLGHVDIEFPLSDGNQLYKVVPGAMDEDEITSEPLLDSGLNEGLN